MERRDVRTVLLVIGAAVLVATAGCSGVTPSGDDPDSDEGDKLETDAPTDTKTTTPADDTGNNVSESTSGPIDDTGLPVDENRVYNVTLDLIGSDADAPTVSVQELDYRTGKTDRPFFDYMGLTNESEGGATGAGASAVTKGPDSVVVSEETADQYGPENIGHFKLILAHEFTHTIQMEEGWTRPKLVRKIAVRETEGLMLYRSLVEGGAMFTADQYADKVGVNFSQTALFEQRYITTASEKVYAAAPYYHGSQYFDTVLDSAKDLSSVYLDDTPPSTEALLHPTYNDTEPSEVEFSAESNRDGWTRQQSKDDQLGAMFVDVVLTAHSQNDAASETTKGWANDELFKYRSDNGSAFAWATHWDTTEDATEFAEAFNRMIGNRTDEEVQDIEVRRTGNRSVVVLAGPQTFRDAIAVDGENANLNIVLQETVDQPTDSQAVTHVNSKLQAAAVR